MSLRDVRTATRSFMMEYDIHTVLDFLTLVATVWVIYELRFPLADTYQKDQDTIQAYYVVRTVGRAPVWPLGCTVVRLCVLHLQPFCTRAAPRF